MLTVETIVALLQGLPSTYTDSLPEPWENIARRLGAAVTKAKSPEAAFRHVVSTLFEWELNVLRDTLEQAVAISQIEGLTHRQREALLALRSSKIVSQAQLCDILGQDRSRIHRRMAILVRKGLAVKFFHKGAAHYFAPKRPNDLALRRLVRHFLANLSAELPAVPAPYFPLSLTEKTTSATSTTGTTNTTSTTPENALLPHLAGLPPPRSGF